MPGRTACLLLGVGAGLLTAQLTAAVVVFACWCRSVSRAR